MVRPDVWGPPVWDAIHFVAAGYPAHPSDADVRAYGDFFRGLADVLPCAPCREHFASHMRDIPPEGPLAAGRAELFAWTVAFHNAVNASLRKPPMTLDAAYDRYFEDARSSSSSSNALVAGTAAAAALVALALIIVAVAAFRRR